MTKKVHEIMEIIAPCPKVRAEQRAVVATVNAARRVMMLPEYTITPSADGAREMVSVSHARRPGYGTALERRLARDMLLAALGAP